MSKNSHSPSRDYGVVARNAAATLRTGEDISYRAAWDRAAADEFPLGPIRTDGSGKPAGVDALDKGCPRSAFVGPCERGWVLEVAGDETLKVASGPNGGHAAEAIRLLLGMSESERQALTPLGLWRLLTGNFRTDGSGMRKGHQGQMEVVLSLWPNHIDRQKVAADTRPTYLTAN